jgi:hypothetical protein
MVGGGTGCGLLLLLLLLMVTTIAHVGGGWLGLADGGGWVRVAVVGPSG